MSEKILQKLNGHDKRFDKVQGTLGAHDKKFDQMQDAFDRHDTQLDSIAHAVVGNRQDIEWIKKNMSTKDDHREVMDVLDTIVRLVKKNDQEITFMGERVKRVSRVEKDVAQLKVANRLA